MQQGSTNTKVQFVLHYTSYTKGGGSVAYAENFHGGVSISGIWW